MSFVFLALHPDQLCILKVVDTHCTLHLSQSLRCHFTCLITAFFQDIINCGNILLQFFSSEVDKILSILHNIIQELLHLHISQTASGIVCFQFVQICIIRQISLKMFLPAESIQISEYGVAFQVSGVAD